MTAGAAMVLKTIQNATTTPRASVKFLLAAATNGAILLLYNCQRSTMNDRNDERIFGDYAVGTRIEGRWEVLRVCGGAGQSGMGVVYVVRDLSTDKVLAGKTFQPQFLSDEKIRKRLRREAEVWMDLGEHPNIVRVEFIEAIGSRLFIFMELVSPDQDGRNSLRHFLQGKQLPTDSVLRWSRGACRGMAHAEKNGLKCHRDLKPDNLMITREGRLKITDFGLARSEVDHQSQPQPEKSPAGVGPGQEHGLTLRGSLLGSPGYIGPEIIVGGQADIRSDIYAFGLILHQMLSGSPMPPLTGLWQGDPLSYERENFDIRSKEQPPPLHPAFDLVISRCLAFSPRERFQSFGETLESLDQIAADLKSTRKASVPPIVTTAWDKPADKQSRRALFDRATSLYSLDRLEEALACIQEVRERFGADYAVWNSEGVILTDLRRHEEALACFKKSIALNQTWVNSWCNIGRCYRAMKQPSDAVVCYEKAITLDSRHAPPWTSKGNCLSDLARQEEALFCFEQALRIDANCWNAWSGKGEVLRKLGRRLDAIVCFEHALRLEPNRKDILRLFQQIRQEVAEHRGPTEKPQTKEHPGTVSKEVLIAKVHELYQHRKLREGLVLISELKKRFGINEDLLVDEAAFLSDLGQYLEAISCVEQALALNPQLAPAWNNKGRALRELGRHEEALPCYDRAISFDPNHVTPWMNKGNCLRALGRKEEARRCYRRVLELDPNNQAAKEAIAAI